MDEDDVMYLITSEIDPVKSEISTLAGQICDLDCDLDSANLKIKSLEREVNELKQIVQKILNK